MATPEFNDPIQHPLPDWPRPAGRWLGGFLAVCCGAPALAEELETDVFAAMSLEQLSDVRVVSVSKREERLGDAPASVFVISADDIRRTGARNLPEALRLAPQLHVALNNQGTYITTARGFAGNSANKQLVMIDGRSIYSPLFSGVFWDAYDLPMESIERIEVVSGPGGTLWGTNAVNGVINIITKPAAATQGGALEARWGEQQSGAAVRYGAPMAGGAWRAYAMKLAMPSGERRDGLEMGDGWNKAQAGFRADWSRAGDSITLQGDVYDGSKGLPATAASPRPEQGSLSGFNVIGRWTRQFDSGASLLLQGYLDQTKRRQPGEFRETLNIIDLQVLYNLARIGGHELAVGAEWRYGRDHTGSLGTLNFLPERLNLRWLSLFGQDTFHITDQLKLTAGLRIERNMYTGSEFLPNLRLAWKASPDALWWGALSRTVRAPSRLDRDLFFGRPPIALVGGPDFGAETARVLELGHRRQVGQSASFSVTLYRALYDDLRTVAPLRPGFFVVANDMEGCTRGIEAWGSYQLTPAWRLSAGVSAQHQHFTIRPGAIDFGNRSTRENFDPRRTAQLRSALALGEHRDLNLTLRHVSALRNTAIPSYTALDVHYAWRMRPNLELSLGASNALDRVHQEYTGANATSLGRGAYVKLISRF